MSAAAIVVPLDGPSANFSDGSILAGARKTCVRPKRPRWAIQPAPTNGSGGAYFGI